MDYLRTTGTSGDNICGYHWLSQVCIYLTYITARRDAWMILTKRKGSDLYRASALMVLDMHWTLVKSEAAHWFWVSQHELTHPKTGQEPMTLLPRVLATPFWPSIPPRVSIYHFHLTQEHLTWLLPVGMWPRRVDVPCFTSMYRCQVTFSSWQSSRLLSRFESTAQVSTSSGLLWYTYIHGSFLASFTVRRSGLRRGRHFDLPLTLECGVCSFFLTSIWLAMAKHFKEAHKHGTRQLTKQYDQVT
jgi:hypothetical protein